MSNTATRHKIWLGRDREVAELEAGLTDLGAGRGSLFLVTGEPGIGKTRLSDEVGRSATARGIAVHWGRTWEVGGAPSYWPVTQVLRSICRGVPDDAIVDAVGPHGAELAELVPELRTRIPSLAQGEDQSTRDRFQLFDAVSTFLYAAASRAPHVIVLDDLHAADLSSLLLLQFLVRDLRSRPLLLIGTYREAEARLSPETATALAHVAREACVVRLRRFDRAEVATYLAQAMGAAPSEDRINRLHQQTEGNPLFLRELLNLEADASRKPEGIREVVRARLSLLTTEVRSGLEAAAVLGREFDLTPLADVAEIPEPRALALLATAVDAAIVEPLGQARWRFTHVLLLEEVYEEIPTERRAALHRAAAGALARGLGEVPPAERAHHLLNAIPAVSLGEAVDAALRAAERAMDVLAFEDASNLLARAAKLVDGAVGEERRMFEVWLALGVARIRSADVDSGKITCQRSAELARKLGDGELFARAVLGGAYEYTPGVRNTELIAVLEEALAMLPPADGALRARCMAQLAAERQPEPDTRQPVELARGAVAMARRLGDKDTLRFTLTAAGLAIMVCADPEERIAINQETLRLALAAHDKRLALRAHLLLFNDHWEKGDVKRGESHIRAYESLAAQFPHGAFHWTMVGIRAALALGEGRFDEAERSFRETEALARMDATRGTSMAALPAGFCCSAERYENVADVELRVRAAFGSMTHDLGGCIGEMLIARIHGRIGDRVRAAAQLAAVRAHPLFPEIKEPAWLSLLAEPCHLLGDVELAEQLFAVILPRAHRFFNLGHLGPWCEPPYSRQLGLLAQTLGRFEDAVAHLTDARTQTANVGMRAHLARLHYELAGALLARGAPGDRECALALLEDARALAEELDQTGLLQFVAERVCEASERRNEAPARNSESVNVSIALLREGDYWTISYGARTVRLRDSRGLRVLDQLLASPGQEFHVIQLVSPGGDDGARGDAGSVLDPEAIQSYRRRLLELRGELEEAEGFADVGRSDRAKSEIDFLTQELARAVGLGGRERRVGNAVERARTTIQKRLREAIRRIEDELPELGSRLQQAVRTGTFCGYFPGGPPRERRA